jgi:hypothetical protein
MPAVAYLLSESGFEIGNTGLSGRRRYIVVGATDDDVAYATARAKAIAEGFQTYFGIPIGSISGAHLGGNVYHVDIKYDPAARTEAAPAVGGVPGGGGGTPAGGEDPSQQMGREWSLSTGGGTRHIVRSRRTVKVTLPTEFENNPEAPRPDYRQVIGLTDTGPEGTDVIAPDPTIRVRRKLAQLTLGYFLLLCRMTATVNLGHWKGFAEGELLFAGADADYRDGDGWNISYTFRFSRNEIAVQVSNSLTVINKRGHDYLWVRYADAAEPVAGVMIKVPKEAMLEEVYEYRDFNALEI